jgi:uncharacterized membrane protein
LNRITPVYIVVAAWVLAMIAVPILRWTFGDSALPAAISLGVLLQAAAVSLIVISAWGVRRSLLTLIVIGALSWLTEYIGSTTGVPFGRYHYTPVLQPQIGGVPLLIPLAWLMMLPPAWAVAGMIAGKDRARRGWAARFVLISALAFTAWDLFLDPQMVAWGLWQWEIPGAYFGIPLVNYAGWLLASALITLVMARIAPIHQLPTRPLLIIYAITWLLETIGLAVFWGLPAPALVGFAAMGGMLWWAWRAAHG